MKCLARRAGGGGRGAPVRREEHEHDVAVPMPVAEQIVALLGPLVMLDLRLDHEHDPRRRHHDVRPQPLPRDLDVRGGPGEPIR